MLYKEVGNRNTERLNYINIDPKTILELNGNKTSFKNDLKTRYPKSEIHTTKDPQQHQDNSTDFIFSNLFLHQQEIQATIKDLQRILTPGGLLLFTTLGPDTLKEHKAVDAPPFQDMHDIGDILLAQGFSDPVMDMETLTFTYKDQQTLLKDIKDFGLSEYLPQELSVQDTYQASYEIIYGHAWGGQNPEEVLVPITSIGKQQ